MEIGADDRVGLRRVVRVMWQGICGVVIARVRKEKATGGSSPC